MENRKFYKALLFSGDHKTVGHVELINKHLIFNSGADAMQLADWDEYSILASFNDQYIGIHSTLEPEKSIFVQDPGFAAALEREIGIKVSSSFRHWWANRPFHAAAMITFLFVILTLSLTAFLRTRGKFLAGFVSQKQELELGKNAFQENWQKDRLDPSGEVKRSWENLLRQLLDQPALKAYDWNIAIVKSDKVNAFALPGGIIALNSELIMKAESADEILGVLAHEVAHVTQRHTLESMAGEMSSSILLSALFMGGANVMGGMIYAADNLQALSFSRAQELAADRLGVQYLQNVKLTTAGMLAFFGRKQGANSSENLSYLSTHPMDDQRLAQIRVLNPADTGTKVSYDLKPLQTWLKVATFAPTGESKDRHNQGF